MLAAVDEGVPAHVLTAALFERFSSRGEADFADRLLSAMRKQFGGHQEKAAEPDGLSAGPGSARRLLTSWNPGAAAPRTRSSAPAKRGSSTVLDAPGKPGPDATTPRIRSLIGG